MMRFIHNYTYKPLEYTVDKYKKVKLNYGPIKEISISFCYCLMAFFAFNYYGNSVKSLPYWDQRVIINNLYLIAWLNLHQERKIRE